MFTLSNRDSFRVGIQQQQVKGGQQPVRHFMVAVMWQMNDSQV
jgi:hypothetical protein